MTYPVNNTGTSGPKATQHDPITDYDPDMDGEYDYNGYDKEGPPATHGRGNNKLEGAPLTTTALRTQVKDLRELLANSDLKPADKKKVEKQINDLEDKINGAAGLSAANKEKILGQIEGDLYKIEDQITSGGVDPTADPDNPDGDDPEVDFKKLIKDLQKAIDDIDGRSNLTDDEKIKLKAPLQKHITDIGLAKKDPSKIDVDKITSDLEEAKTDTDKQDAYSPGLKGLADTTDMSPEEIKGKAEAKGIDLDKLTLPPSMEILNFLTEIIPDLKDAFKKVETAVSDRIKSIQDNSKSMNDIAKFNCDKGTSEACNTSMEPWQNLFNLKHFQDGESKKVAGAMEDLVKTLTPIFKALYPGQEVKAVEDNSPGGWQKAEGAYKVADKIQIGTITIDLINNTTGKMQSTNQPDTDINIAFNDLWGDSEGSGEWNPPALQTYGDAQPTKMDNETDKAW